MGGCQLPLSRSNFWEWGIAGGRNEECWCLGHQEAGEAWEKGEVGLRIDLRSGTVNSGQVHQTQVALPSPCSQPYKLGDCSQGSSHPGLWLTTSLPPTDGALLDLREVPPPQGLAGVEHWAPAPGEKAAQVCEPALPETLLRPQKQPSPERECQPAGPRSPEAGLLPQEPAGQPALSFACLQGLARFPPA